MVPRLSSRSGAAMFLRCLVLLPFLAARRALPPTHVGCQDSFRESVQVPRLSLLLLVRVRRLVLAPFGPFLDYPMATRQKMPSSMERARLRFCNPLEPCRPTGTDYVWVNCQFRSMARAKFPTWSVSYWREYNSQSRDWHLPPMDASRQRHAFGTMPKNRPS